MTKNVIVTTSISAPTSALRAYFKFPGWTIILAGDKKTPHKEYLDLMKQNENFVYLHPDEQHELNPELSDLIGWNCIQRRYAAVLHAYVLGAEIFAFADDDNHPYDTWDMDASNLKCFTEVNCFIDKTLVLDPYSVTEHADIWHRGYPLDLVSQRNPIFTGKRTIKPLVIERLVDGDPDIDAVCRLPFRPMVKFQPIESFTTENLTVFNSQNTLIAKAAIPYYLNLPHVGRFDDIFGSYLFQRLSPFLRPYVMFASATVYQERVPQDLIKNLEQEIFGYRHTNAVALQPLDEIRKILPEKTVKAYKLWNEVLGVKTAL
jgi:hypothetical protein